MQPGQNKSGFGKEQSEKVSELLQVGSVSSRRAKNVFGHKQLVMHCKTLHKEIFRGWDGWHGEEKGERHRYGRNIFSLQTTATKTS